MKERTIVAQSTPVGKGGIAIVRMSGPKAETLLYKCFKPLSKKERLLPNELTLGIVSTDEINDKAMAVLFKSPKSYTGEDLVEIHLHGSQEIVNRVIKHLIKLGARLAEHGEFTRRAFLSGKIRLNEAEAVGDLINAKSTAEINAAFSSLKGQTAKELKDIYDSMVDIVSSFDAAIDYPEENVEETLLSDAKEKLLMLQTKVDYLIKSYESGHKIRDGIRVALLGEPNAGKSSLMNRLLGKDRAIVTNIPGTTRDTIEESFEYNGVLFTLVDTAGLHETTDIVEMEGIKRSTEEGSNADITIVLKPVGSSEIDVKANTIIHICSKCDLARDEKYLNVSAKTGEGIELLKEKLFDLSNISVVAGGCTITNSRQYGLILNCKNDIDDALYEISNGSLVDLVMVGIKGALNAIGEIIGANATEDVLDSIFSKFCVGK